MAMSGITDFHSHILPGIDDGCRTVAESLELLQMESEQGITRVVATPHFYPQRDNPDRFLRRREASELLLREAMAGRSDLPQVHVGAEVYYFRGMSDSEMLTELAIDRKKAILVEMPRAPWTDAMYRDLEGLCGRRGLTPVIAHVDRYLSVWRDFGIPDRLAELPVLVQANGDFFLDWTTARKALQMLKTEKIHLLGSDCHNTTDRKPNLGKTVDIIRKHLGEGALERMEFRGNSIL